MKELVFMTGATGFIGKYIVDRLLAKGYAIRCLIRESSNIDYLKDKPDIQTVVGDITKPETLKGIGDGVSYVLHLAATGHIAAMSEEAFREFVSINEGGTRNLIEAFKGGGLKKFISFSSTAAMGPVGTDIQSEKSIPNPKTPYQKSKLRSEQVALDAFKEGFPSLIVRPCMVYGVGGKGAFYTFYRLMTKGRFPRVGKGESLTPMAYVTDVADGAIAAMERGKPGEVYILAGAQSYGIDDIRNTIVKYAGGNPPYVHLPKGLAFFGVSALEKLYTLLGKEPIATLENVKSSAADRTFDISKARSEIGYDPRVGLDEGIKKTVGWYKEMGY